MICVRLDLAKRIAVQGASVAAEEAVNLAAELHEDMNPYSRPEMLVDPFDLVIA